MKLHILTLTWNGIDKLQALRPGLMSALEPFDATWYIKDNGSNDGTSAVISQWEKTRCFETGHNRDSFAQGMNYLFDQANPSDDDLVLLLNNDVIFNDANSLKRMVELMRLDTGMVGARLLYTNTKKLQHAGVIFSNRYGKMPFHYRPGEIADEHSSKSRYFQAVTAAVCLVKAGCYRKAEGMDQNFKWAFEDIDLALRIGRNHKIAYCGETSIFHEESASLKKNPVQKLFMSSNVAHFKKKWWNGNVPKYTIDHELYLNNKNYNVIE